MSKTLKVSGQRISASQIEDADLADFGLTVETKEAVDVQAAARGEAEEITLQGADDDIVEITRADGVQEWVTLGELHERLETTTPHLVRGSTMQMPLTLTDTTTRGPAETILEKIKTLDIDPKKLLSDLGANALADLAAKTVVRYFEDRYFEKELPTGPGLYHVRSDGKLVDPISPSATLDPQEPYLVLIHGTFSTTNGTFGGMVGTQEWDNLHSRYQNRVLALEHRTLSENPAENALQLAERLPGGATLHLVSHSRGGLVGEFLSRGPLSAQDLLPFRRSNRTTRDEEIATFERLTEVLHDKQFAIDRFVRVACPARGTLLASKRLSRYFSVILNLINAIPVLRSSIVYPFAKATILALIKRRTMPGELPGLEAQMPESPFIYLLNRPRQPDTASDTDLAVIAGDIQGKGFFGRLKVFATDLYYQEDHDLVVNTGSMYAGFARTKAYFSFEKGPDISHFNYFRNTASRELLYNWLAREGSGPAKGFEEIGRKSPDVLTRSATRASLPDDAPVVFFVPGLMASHLSGNGHRLWPSTEMFSENGLKSLMLQDHANDTPEVIAAPYQALFDHLSARYHVLPFAYDWRKSAKEEGGRFAGTVEAELLKHQRPVHLLAHSTGGMVARMLCAYYPELWQQFRARGGRLVMLGTPNHGSHAILRMMTDQHPLTRMLALLDPAATTKEVQALFATFPGLLELLPEDDAFNVWNPKTWEDAGFEIVPDAKALQAARQVRATLDGAVDAEGMCYVAGKAPVTPDGLLTTDSLIFRGTTQGDGFSTYELGLLDTVPTWYADAAHGDLADYPPAFIAYSALLESGRTDLLSTRPLQSAESTPFALPTDIPVLFPTEEDLLNAALMRSAAKHSTDVTVSLRVSVTHGSLEYARHPVAVGHYYGDVIVGAEKFLDWKLGGRLTDRHMMNLYPDEAGTVEVVLVPESKPPGGLVIGLGEVGRITPEIITQGISEAALRLALMRAEQPASKGEENGWRSAAFSSVLIGTNSGNSLSIESSVAAIVKGAMQANRMLLDWGLFDRVRIDEIEFVELYEDLATHAAHAVCDLNTHLRIIRRENEQLEPLCYLRANGTGQHGRPALEYNTDWWRRLQITRAEDTNGDAEDHDLKYVMLTDRARAEETLQATQRKLVDQFVSNAILKSDLTDNLPATLFELLWPNALKEQARETANLVLILDKTAAQYPWEMLAERTHNRNADSMAFQMGMVRQLQTMRFREKVQPPRGNNVLVIGDPQVDTSIYPSLAGARVEAQCVAEALAPHYDVTSLIGKSADAVSIITKLFSKEYRILHIAGHGKYDARHPERSGVVIGEDIYLTAAEIGQLRVVPELVFLNCCHLGNMKDDAPIEDHSTAYMQTRKAWNRLAASLAQELIRMGVRVVIAAGWAVNDKAAATFAFTFYDHLLVRQQPFGDAVRQARRQTYEKHQDTNTWGAYQCYGDPGFRLGTRSGQNDHTPPRHVAQHEILRELQNICLQAKAAASSPETKKKHLQRVRDLQSMLQPEWRTARMCAGLGAALGELGIFEEAIDLYSKALNAQDSEEVTIKVIQQLVNLNGRYADTLRSQADKAATVQELLEKAGERLNWILALQETPERLALAGSLQKRLALASKGRVRGQALKKAEEYYGRWQNLMPPETPCDYYNTLNWVALRFIRHGSENKKELLDFVERSKAAAIAERAQRPSFWNHVTVADAELYLALLNKDLDKRLDEIALLYRTVFAAGGSPREHDSALKQMDILIELLSWKKRTQPATALRKLRQRLSP